MSARIDPVTGGLTANSPECRFAQRDPWHVCRRNDGQPIWPGMTCYDEARQHIRELQVAGGCDGCGRWVTALDPRPVHLFDGAVRRLCATCAATPARNLPYPKLDALTGAPARDAAAREARELRRLRNGFLAAVPFLMFCEWAVAHIGRVS